MASKRSLVIKLSFYSLMPTDSLTYEIEMSTKIFGKTRRLAACTQAVQILRSTKCISIVVNVLHLKSYEIQSNRCMCAQAILHFLELINDLLLICRPYGREMSQGLYISL